MAIPADDSHRHNKPAEGTCQAYNAVMLESRHRGKHGVDKELEEIEGREKQILKNLVEIEKETFELLTKMDRVLGHLDELLRRVPASTQATGITYSFGPATDKP